MVENLGRHLSSIVVILGLPVQAQLVVKGIMIVVAATVLVRGPARLVHRTQGDSHGNRCQVRPLKSSRMRSTHARCATQWPRSSRPLMREATMRCANTQQSQPIGNRHRSTRHPFRAGRVGVGLFAGPTETLAWRLWRGEGGNRPGFVRQGAATWWSFYAHASHQDRRDVTRPVKETEVSRFLMPRSVLLEGIPARLNRAREAYAAATCAEFEPI
jgi:hypothetical protein